jgi:hypothetical protein
MRYRWIAGWALSALLVFGTGSADGNHHIGGGGPTHRHGHGIILAGGWGWGSYGLFGVPYYVTIGPNGQPVVVGPPLVTVLPGPLPAPVFDRGVLAGPMPRVVRPVVRPAVAAPRANGNVKKADTTKGDQLVTIGDRLFRAGNLKRAVERYEQAVRLDPGAAGPLIRLAQVALLRSQYAEAADRIRQAIAADPAWLARAPDIQSVYGEPGEFNRPIAKLESHLLADPNDRDGWLVLGAQYYLSGQTRKAADVFLRLTDRKPDPALAAFLDATGAKPAAAE